MNNNCNNDRSNFVLALAGNKYYNFNKCDLDEAQKKISYTAAMEVCTSIGPIQNNDLEFQLKPLSELGL